MAKNKREPKKKASLKPEAFLEPIDITKFGTDDDPCFGKLYNLADDACRRCGDSGLCGLVFGQSTHKDRKKIEKENRFKDLEINSENKALINWVKEKKKEGLERMKIISKGVKTFGVTRQEIKQIYKNL